jgi:hypothetical protein
VQLVSPIVTRWRRTVAPAAGIDEGDAENFTTSGGLADGGDAEDFTTFGGLADGAQEVIKVINASEADIATATRTFFMSFRLPQIQQFRKYRPRRQMLAGKVVGLAFHYRANSVRLASAEDSVAVGTATSSR